MSPRRRTRDHDLPAKVYRHGNGFRLRVYVDGRPGWRRLQATTVAEVWREIDALRDPTPGTIGAGIDRYIERTVPELLAAGHMKASTWRTEERRARALRRIYGHLYPHEITAPLLYELPEQVGDGWRMLKRFSAIWKHLMRWGMATHDPFVRFDWPQQRARTRYVTDAELARAQAIALEAAQDGRRSALYVWSLLTLVTLVGRRMTDVRQLMLTQIEDGVGIHFRESKTGKLTTVAWSAELGRAITEIKARLHPGTKIAPMYLICNRDGQPVSEGALNQAFQRLRPAFAAGGLEPFQPRDLRAKYGTDHEDGREALRHSSEQTFRKHYDRKGAVVKPLK